MHLSDTRKYNKNLAAACVCFLLVVPCSILVDWHPLFYNSFLEVLWDADKVLYYVEFICVTKILSIKSHQAAIMSSDDLHYIKKKKSILTALVRAATSWLFPQRVRHTNFVNIIWILYTLLSMQLWNIDVLPNYHKFRKKIQV